eukprot:scaffold84294_cov54-Phaeocystis_antarctica.AAC.1
MALSKLSGDEQCIIFSQLCNVLDPRVAVAFSSTSNELHALTQALLQQLRADHEVAAVLAAALCHKMRMRNCKKLREAKKVTCADRGLSANDLVLLATLGSVLPALEELWLIENPLLLVPAAGHDGVQRLFEGLGAGALPAVSFLSLCNLHVGNAGALALAAALGRGALPRLKCLQLSGGAIGDAGLVALAPALRRRPALDTLSFMNNPFGDEGLAALVAPPPPPAGALLPPTKVLAKLKTLVLYGTQITDAGCAALAYAVNSGALPALKPVSIGNVPASAASIAAVTEALTPNLAVFSDVEDEDEDEDEE